MKATTPRFSRDEVSIGSPMPGSTESLSSPAAAIQISNSALFARCLGGLKIISRTCPRLPEHLFCLLGLSLGSRRSNSLYPGTSRSIRSGQVAHHLDISWLLGLVSGLGEEEILKGSQWRLFLSSRRLLWSCNLLTTQSSRAPYSKDCQRNQLFFRSA